MISVISVIAERFHRRAPGKADKYDKVTETGSDPGLLCYGALGEGQQAEHKYQDQIPAAGVLVKTAVLRPV